MPTLKISFANQCAVPECDGEADIPVTVSADYEIMLCMQHVDELVPLMHETQAKGGSVKAVVEKYLRSKGG